MHKLVNQFRTMHDEFDRVVNKLARVLLRHIHSYKDDELQHTASKAN